MKIDERIAAFVIMLQGFVTVCQKKLDLILLEKPTEYQCGKRCFEIGEISLDEISKHNSDDYLLTFHLFQTIDMIEEMVVSLQLTSKKSVFPYKWWACSLGYWYGTRCHLIDIIYQKHPDVFVSIYPMEYMHIMVKNFFEKRLVDIQERPGRFYIFSIDLRRLFAEKIWWMCYKNYPHTLHCNAVYYYLGEELYYEGE